MRLEQIGAAARVITSSGFGDSRLQYPGSVFGEGSASAKLCWFPGVHSEKQSREIVMTRFGKLSGFAAVAGLSAMLILPAIPAQAQISPEGSNALLGAGIGAIAGGILGNGNIGPVLGGAAAGAALGALATPRTDYDYDRYGYGYGYPYGTTYGYSSGTPYYPYTPYSYPYSYDSYPYGYSSYPYTSYGYYGSYPY